MNKTLLSTALVAVMAAVGFAPTAQAADGTITITGKVVANSCSFKVNGGSASSTVVLPVVFYTDLAGSGSVTGATPINISVTGCDSNLTSVQEKFSGANILTDGNLKNSGTAGTAVEVQLTNSSGTALDLGTNGGLGNSPVVNITGGAATMAFKAQYYAPAALTAANVGTVSTTVTYTTQYL